MESVKLEELLAVRERSLPSVLEAVARVRVRRGRRKWVRKRSVEQITRLAELAEILWEDLEEKGVFRWTNEGVLEVLVEVGEKR